MTSKHEASATHTPGPWNMNEGSPDIGIVTEKVLIAMVPSDEDYPCEREEQEANARLIAQAPALLAERDRLREVNAELIAALRDIYTEAADVTKRTIGDDDFTALRNIMDVAYRTASAAIARAEGKP